MLTTALALSGERAMDQITYQGCGDVIPLSAIIRSLFAILV
jgi:hypothetical protein